MWLRAVKVRAEAIALTHADQHLSYQQLHDTVRAVSRGSSV